MKSRKHTTITIPILLYEKLNEKIEGTGFGSVSDYTTYLLREVLASLEERGEKKIAFTKEEMKRLKQRLKALGYI
jgi:Arc/MetJ-type ribon-helix-helix transcriptional regulator